MSDTPSDQLHDAVAHDGDCACWKPDCLICDCGALRRTVRRGGFDAQLILDAWTNHLLAIEASIEHPPFTKKEQRKMRVNQYGEPLDPSDTSNWEETTQP